jgi:hypothetical protein
MSPYLPSLLILNIRIAPVLSWCCNESQGAECLLDPARWVNNKNEHHSEEYQAYETAPTGCKTVSVSI